MPKVVIDSSSFKKNVKTLKAFADRSHRKIPIIAMAFDPNFRLFLSTEHAFINATPKIIEWDKQAGNYYLNADPLLSLTISNDAIELSWSDEKSPIRIKDGKVIFDLKIAAPAPSYDALPREIKAFKVPTSLLCVFSKQLEIPYSYYKANRDLTVLRLFTDAEHNLCAESDDSYSVAQVTTDFKLDQELDLKIPKYALDLLLAESDSTDSRDTNIGVSGPQVMIQTPYMSGYIATSTENTTNFEEIKKHLSDPWFTSFKFDPKILYKTIKQLHSMLPAKDRSGSIIVMSISQEGVDFQIRHRERGDATVAKVEGISEQYNEGGMNFSHVNMHPQAFLDYTDLMAKVNDKGDAAEFFANRQTAYYKGKTKILDKYTCTAEYLFPTVQV